MSTAPKMSLRAALSSLAKEKRLVAKATPDSSWTKLRDAVLPSCSRDVVAWLDFVATHSIKSIGIWRFAKPNEMAKKPAAAAPFYERAAIAAATSTLFLGKDGGGLQFYVLRSKTLSEVFVQDPGAGQFALLATSLAAFVELNALVARWDEVCEEDDLDPDPELIDDGDIDFSLPKFAALRARAKALKGSVNLVAGSDYDETVCALAKATLRAKSKSDAEKRYKLAKLGRA